MDPSVLRDRLREVVRGTAPAGLPLPAATGNRARSFDDLGGAWRETAAGRSFVVSRRVDPDAAHGSQSVRMFGDRLRLAEPSAMLVGANLARAPFLFFDLETTGLNGGAGTCAFLVGCGWFDEDGAFVTEQHLLMDYAGEPAMLRGVAEQVASAGALVTFNGKSFDAPVLETRYLFHRLTSPCTGLAHVDLLHPARRFWGSTDEAGCSLVALESRLLGLRRKGDVPGFEIPARYFHFVRSGDARPLAAVLEHNRLDLLSLAGLTARLFALVDSGPAQAGDAKEALALARVYERAGLDERAEASLLRAETLAGDTATRIGALRGLALGARRQRRFEEAAGHWRRLLDTPGCPATLTREAIEALAIHHEHRARDLDAAKMFALRGLEAGTESAWGDAVRHRLARIERKIVSASRPLLSSLPLLLPACDSPTSGSRTSS